jgi:hypothetical protein
MFNCKILRIFSFLCLVRSSSHNSNPATIHFDECLNLTENNSYSQVSGDPNFSEQSSKATKRTFSDLEDIDGMRRNKLFASTHEENQSLIDSENGQDDDGSLNIFEIKDRSTYLDSLRDGSSEYQLDDLFSFTSSVISSSDNSSHPSISDASEIPLKDSLSSEESTISEKSAQHQYTHVIDNVTVSSKEIINDSSTVNCQNSAIIPKKEGRKESFQICSDLREFIAKVIYFRKDFYEFINICMEEDDPRNHFKFEIKSILQDNPEYEYLFTSLRNNEKLAIRNIMLLIHLSLDFAKRIEMTFETVKRYLYLTQLIFHQNKKLAKLETRLNNLRLSEKTRFELSQEIECMKKET